MDKILVVIYVPFLQKEFDMYFTPDMTVNYVVGIIKDFLTQKYSGYFTSASSADLCFLPEGTLVNKQLTVRENNIQTGARLMFY